MKFKLILILLFTCNFVFAQVDTLYVKGKVSVVGSFIKAEEVKIVLRLNDGRLVGTSVFPDGSYEMKVINPSFSTFMITHSHENSKTPSYCFGAETIPAYSILDSSGTVNVNHNFLIEQEKKEIVLPRFLFNKSALTFSSLIMTEDSIKGSLNALYETLVANPTIIIEIGGHASYDEKSAIDLSQRRAERVKSELVKMGINVKRLVTKGYGTSKPKFEPYVFELSKTKEDKEKLYAYCRRCVFKIINWDYKEEK